MSVSILSRAYTKHSKFVPAPRFTTPTALPISDNSSTVFNEVLDDQRAQREKMLKIRFARTIKRAKTFLKGGSSDLEEKERAVSLKPQKKATTESHSRIQLEKRRKAARMALEEMEKTVVVDDNFKVMKELKILLGDNGGNSRKLMGVLGLHLKKVEEEEE